MNPLDRSLVKGRVEVKKRTELQKLFWLSWEHCLKGHLVFTGDSCRHRFGDTYPHRSTITFPTLFTEA